MEFIEKQLFDIRLDEFPHLDMHHLKSDNPIIIPITTEWQKEKCYLLEIQFNQTIDQHSTMAGKKLRDFEPWECDTIEADGNCLFRCLSKLISGSEEYHSKVRGEICRYMLSDGKDTIGWYFTQTLTTTPSDHLSSTCMYNDGNWGTDTELITASALLEADIYIANKVFRTKESITTGISWSRIRASNNYDKNPALYIANYSDHYQPVTRMINCKNPTFFFQDTAPINID